MKGAKVKCLIDANYVFDLDTGGILDCPPYLGYTFLMANFIAHEIATISHERLRLCGMQIADLEPGQVSEIYELLREHRGLSYRDLAAFVLARDTQSILVTGDGHLRTMAGENDIECHGTLWILDALVDAGILTGPRAADALRTMQANNRRLPKTECDARIRTWRPQSSPTAVTHPMMRDTIGLLFPASLVALSISTAGMYRCAARRGSHRMAAAP